MGLSSSSVCENSNSYSRVFDTKFPAYFLSKMQRLNKSSSTSNNNGNSYQEPPTTSQNSNRSKRNNDSDSPGFVNHPVSCISQIPTKGILKLQNLKRKVSKFKRKINSNNLDYPKLFNEFISTWSYKELQALKHEYEALDIIYEIIKQSNNSRPNVNTLMQDFDVLFKTGLYADTEISYRGEIFRVHRSILSIRSTFFRQCFYSWEAQPDIMLSSYNTGNGNTVNKNLVTSSSSSSSSQNNNNNNSTNNCDICNNTNNTNNINTNQMCIMPIHLDNPSITPEIFRNILQYIYTEQLIDFDDDYIDNCEMIYLLREKFHLPNRLQLDMKRLFENTATDNSTDCMLIFSQSNDYVTELDFLPFDRKTIAKQPNLIHFNRHFHYTSNHTNVSCGDRASSNDQMSPVEEDQTNPSLCIDYDTSYNPNNTYELPCHKAILAARSVFFRKIIELKTANLQNSAEKVMKITLEESIISYRYARVLLNCLYTGQLNMELMVTRHSSLNVDNRSTTLDLTASLQNNGAGGNGPMYSSGHAGLSIHSFLPHCLECIYDAMQLYQIGTYLDFKILCHTCEDLLVANINLDNCLNLLRWSGHSYGSSFVRRHVVTWMREEFSTFYQSKYFGELSKKELIELISSQFIQSPEPELLHAVYRWAELRVERSNNHASNIASNISSSSSTTNNATSNPGQTTTTNKDSTTTTTTTTTNSLVFLLKDMYMKRPQSKLKYQNDTKIAQLLAEIIPHLNLAHIYSGTDHLFNSLTRRGIVPTNTLSHLSAGPFSDDVKHSWCRMIASKQDLRNSQLLLYRQEPYNLMGLIDRTSTTTLEYNLSHHHHHHHTSSTSASKFRGPRYVVSFYKQVKLVLAEKARTSLGGRTGSGTLHKSPIYTQNMSLEMAGELCGVAGGVPQQQLLWQNQQGVVTTPLLFKTHGNARSSLHLTAALPAATPSPVLNQRLLTAVWGRAKDLQSGPLIQRALHKPCVSLAVVFHLLRLQTLREFGLPDQMVEEIFSSEKALQEPVHASRESVHALPPGSMHSAASVVLDPARDSSLFDLGYLHAASAAPPGSQTMLMPRKNSPGTHQQQQHYGPVPYHHHNNTSSSSTASITTNRYSAAIINTVSTGAINSLNYLSNRSIRKQQLLNYSSNVLDNSTSQLDRSQLCLTTNKICQCPTPTYTTLHHHSRMHTGGPSVALCPSTASLQRMPPKYTTSEDLYKPHNPTSPYFLSRKSYPTSPSVLLLPSALDHPTPFLDLHQHHQHLYQTSEQHRALYQSTVHLHHDDTHPNHNHHHHQYGGTQQRYVSQNSSHYYHNPHNYDNNSTTTQDEDNNNALVLKSRRYSLKIHRHDNAVAATANTGHHSKPNDMSFGASVYNVGHNGYTTLPNRHNHLYNNYRRSEIMSTSAINSHNTLVYPHLNKRYSSYLGSQSINTPGSVTLETHPLIQSVMNQPDNEEEVISPSSYNPWVFNGFNFKTPPQTITNNSHHHYHQHQQHQQQHQKKKKKKARSKRPGDDDNNHENEDEDDSAFIIANNSTTTTDDGGEDDTEDITIPAHHPDDHGERRETGILSSVSSLPSNVCNHPHHHHHKTAHNTHSPIYGVKKHQSSSRHTTNLDTVTKQRSDSCSTDNTQYRFSTSSRKQHGQEHKTNPSSTKYSSHTTKNNSSTNNSISTNPKSSKNDNYSNNNDNNTNSKSENIVKTNSLNSTSSNNNNSSSTTKTLSNNAPCSSNSSSNLTKTSVPDKSSSSATSNNNHKRQLMKQRPSSTKSVSNLHQHHHHHRHTSQTRHHHHQAASKSPTATTNNATTIATTNTNTSIQHQQQEPQSSCSSTSSPLICLACAGPPSHSISQSTTHLPTALPSHNKAHTKSGSVLGFYSSDNSSTSREVEL